MAHAYQAPPASNLGAAQVYDTQENAAKTTTSDLKKWVLFMKCQMSTWFLDEDSRVVGDTQA